VAARPTSTLVDLTGRALLLGDQGDVRLADLTGGDLIDEPATQGLGPWVGARVATAGTVAVVVASGAGLLVVPSALAGSPDVAAASEAGVVVVVTGQAEIAGAAALDLLANGGVRGRVVLEVPVMPHLPALTTADVHQLGELGLLAGVLFPPLPRVTDEAIGWEIGIVTRLLGAGVRTFRGLDATRFDRVRAVHDAIKSAGVHPEEASS